MYLYELLTEWWWIGPLAMSVAGLVAAISIPPSSDALDLVQRAMARHAGRMAERAREYQRLRKMELPR